MSSNMLTGSFPVDYFAEDNFQKLRYLNLNFNSDGTNKLEVPDICIRYAFCFKKQYLASLDGMGFEMYYVGAELEAKIAASSSDYSTRNVDL